MTPWQVAHLYLPEFGCCSFVTFLSFSFCLFISFLVVWHRIGVEIYLCVARGPQLHTWNCLNWTIHTRIFSQLARSPSRSLTNWTCQTLNGCVKIDVRLYLCKVIFKNLFLFWFSPFSQYSVLQSVLWINVFTDLASGFSEVREAGKRGEVIWEIVPFVGKILNWRVRELSSESKSKLVSFHEHWHCTSLFFI